MQVVILCGGRGTRFREQTQYRPKPMIEIGGRPILWHIMKAYSHYGFSDFVLCLGYKGKMIRDYFLNYSKLMNDITVDVGSGDVEILNGDRSEPWRVTLVDTGLEAMTGARVKRVEAYVHGDQFLLTYGDGVTNLDIRDLVEFHRSHDRIGTVTGVSPTSRYGELAITDGVVTSFQEKPAQSETAISGGYFVFERRFFDYLTEDDGCVLEHEPLERLSQEEHLRVYEHKDFWQCMDTARDWEYLSKRWKQGDAPWRVWGE